MSVVAVIGVGLYWNEGPAIAAVAVIFLVSSLASFFFPTHYRVDEKGVSCVNLGLRWRRPWAMVRRIELDAKGIFVSPFERPNWLDPFRGLFLRCEPELRDRLSSVLRSRLSAAEEQADGVKP